MVFNWVDKESGKLALKYRRIRGITHPVMPAPALSARAASPQESEGIQAGVAIFPNNTQFLFEPVGRNGGWFHFMEKGSRSRNPGRPIQPGNYHTRRSKTTRCSHPHRGAFGDQKNFSIEGKKQGVQVQSWLWPYSQGIATSIHLHISANPKLTNCRCGWKRGCRRNGC